MTRSASIGVGLLLLVLAECGLAEVAVVDDTGRRVELEQPARRIVSLAPHVTEMLYAAGAGDRVVAAVSYSDYPEAAKELPRVGAYNRFDIEQVLAHEPDLVVGWQSGNPEVSLQKLRQLGPSLYITEPRSMEAIATNLERLGRLAGTAGPAADAAAEFRRQHRALRDRYADRPSLDVFYEIWNDPLMTINGEHLISDIIRGCGGRNVFGDLPAIAPRISVEAVLARDPEVLIASGMDDERPEWLDEWKQWPELRAVRRDHLFFIPPNTLQRHTPRVLEGMARMCKVLEEARS
ncbi:MAG: cobalamin-binding protein [Halofilum sp. (in: g-proteobacteria)]|nr:cobalamin-binding protein [Halofilum sp. (in: g-proteobacteria)]